MNPRTIHPLRGYPPVGLPPRQGLYDPQFEHDACGVGFVAHIKGQKSNQIIRDALKVLMNLRHRGACGCEANTGDGAGILLQKPHAFLKQVCAEHGIRLPDAEEYGVGMLFLPPDPTERHHCEQLFEEIVTAEGCRLLGWRTVPTHADSLGETARRAEPKVRQVFIGRDSKLADAGTHAVGDAFERKLYVIRKLAENRIRYAGLPGSSQFYIASLSYKTMIYKGMLMTEQVVPFYPDLADPSMESALALVHSRFSTNTFPSWDRAHPYRYLAHNGEINTLRGNTNWMRARQAMFESDLFGDDLSKLLPILHEDGSDSQVFDNCLEFLVLSGRSLPHAVMMMVPAPWENHESMPDDHRAFYEYHSSLMEPWDGPASIAFTDGVRIGACLDRNGLRPSRYYVTRDDRVIMASEVGVLDVPPDQVVQKGRLQPGRMFLIDTELGRIVSDEELKNKVAAEHPYRLWLNEQLVHLEDLPEGVGSWELGVGEDKGPSLSAPTPNSQLPIPALAVRQQTFGYTFEDLRFVVAPMAREGVQPLGAMGNDTPLAVLSNKSRLLYDYFKQLFAQVTNPPIDCIREELITSTDTLIGSEQNLLKPGPASCRQIRLRSPILTNEELEKLRHVELSGFKATTLPILFASAEGAQGLEAALETLFAQADEAISEGVNILVLSDRGISRDLAPVPALLAVSALHHHLIRTGTRTRVGLVLESGEPREVHHFALLIGYGAGAINPYLAYETLGDMIRSGMLTVVDHKTAIKNYAKAVTKSIVKTMAKMGISTIQSYRGAQIFEAIGLNRAVIDRYFTGTASQVEGIGLDGIAEEVRKRHTRPWRMAPIDAVPVLAATPLTAAGHAAHSGNGTNGHETNGHGPAPNSQLPTPNSHAANGTNGHAVNGHALDPGGQYQWRSDGENHLFSPRTIHKLQYACRANNYAAFKEYSEGIDNQAENLCTLRGLLDLKLAGEPIPIEEVEPVDSLVKRFKTGAMSYGSISQEAHEALAIAMNRLGGKSNTGEGGEDPARYFPMPNGDSKNSAIKQVASGRFGVTSNYLVNARELQIKMAQGAKPGEGGELPGRKVYPWIAKTRHSTPGVGLISPPPHHDIYSIEDLAELIHDLKNANHHARISVKLVSEIGVGTVAAGVAKAHADVVLISGHDGGTGASPLSSIYHSGTPWELGLAETHQTLVLNNLRSRIAVETDGQLKTGRDVVIAALLGAEEFGMATAPLVVLGCIMMRVCHLNTCPVGVATQDPELRKRFTGSPDHVVNFMRFIAQEVREWMALLGFRKLTDMVGRTDLLEPKKAIDHWKANGLDLSRILYQPKVGPEVGRYCQIPQDHGLDEALDNTVLLKLCEPALERGEPVRATLPIQNTNRVVGTITGSELSRRHGPEGLPDDTIRLHFQGSAGQSFGAFIPRGMTLILEGDANDYLGKGMSGGKIILFPPAGTTFAPEENIITGNVAFYGATAGEAYIRGMAGERFCVRNSGVRAVVEAVGDHGCEYMTGGRVVVLGPTGRNFAAGMSGGVAYVLDLAGDFPRRCNLQMIGLEALDDAEEIAEVRAMVERHVGYTGSEHARSILDRWAEMVPKFVKVMPLDYRRVLEATRRVTAAGLSGEEAVMAAFEENVRSLARVGGS